MIDFNWSAVTGLVSWSIGEPHREPLPKPQTRIERLSPKAVVKEAITPRSRESKGNHKWRLSVLKKELKRKQNGRQ